MLYTYSVLLPITDKTIFHKPHRITIFIQNIMVQPRCDYVFDRFGKPLHTSWTNVQRKAIDILNLTRGD